MRVWKVSLPALVLTLLVGHINPVSTQTAGGKGAVLDVPMLFRGPMPAVEVLVNGQGPFLFALDTGGGGQARVDTTLVERLKLKVVGQVQAGDGSGHNTRNMDVVELDTLTLGGVEFKGVRAGTRNYNTSPNFPKVDGILGFNLFEAYLLTLDFPGKRIRLERGELPRADGAEVLSFENPRGIPVIEIGKDEFGLEIVPEARIKFSRDDTGKVVAINILNRAGEWERAAREQP